MTHETLNWHPWRVNPLDFIGVPLQRPDGTPVTLTRSNLDFVVTIGGKEISRTMDNSSTCGVLWNAEVGLAQP